MQTYPVIVHCEFGTVRAHDAYKTGTLTEVKAGRWLLETSEDRQPLDDKQVFLLISGGRVPNSYGVFSISVTAALGSRLVEHFRDKVRNDPQSVFL